MARGQTARQSELELLKALAVVAMLFCHPVIRLGIHHAGYEGEFLFFLGDVIFGDYLAAAHAFMFAMGVGTVWSQKNSPRDLARRGALLYLLGYALNFCRYGVWALADGLISGVFEQETLEALFGPDILQFAGLALLFTALLKKLKLRPLHMLAVGAALSAAASAIPFVDAGSFPLNWLLGHFIYTTHDASCFVFCSWYVFVAAGIAFGTLLRKTEDRDRLYKKLFVCSAPAAALYIAATCVFGALFLSRGRVYYAASLAEAAGLLSVDLCLLSAFYFLLKRVPARKLGFFLGLSRELTPIYLIHWCILGFIDSIFCYLLGVSFSWPAIYGIGAAFLILSGLLAMRRTARAEAKARKGR